MNTQLIAGQSITLDSFDGAIVRVVVEVLGDVVVVCRQEELDRAKRERRSPLTVGFRMKDVIKIGDSTK